MSALLFTIAPLTLLPMSSVGHGRVIVPSRSRTAVAYLDEPNQHQLSDARSTTVWTKTAGGLSYRDNEPGDGNLLAPGQLVKVAFTVSASSTGEVVVRSSETFELGSEGSASNKFFEEITSGLRVGSQRTVRVHPSSDFAMVKDDTIVFDIEVEKVLTGLEALGYRARLNRRFVFQLCILLTFAPDILNFLGVPPPATPFAFGAPGFGAVDVLSNAAPAVDPVNQWAVDGLKGVLF